MVGWYHSHPGYGCWLSGIDVNTQSLNQQFQDPWLAIVVDPMKTVSAGKVDIGAFRTYPKDYKPSTESTSNVSIPLAKAIDFGAHCNQYYQLEISYFKSELDASLLSSLWQKYWKNTLSSSNLYLNRKYHSNLIVDLSAKIEDVKKLGGCVKDSARLSVECNHGAIMQVLKHRLFNT